MQLNQRKNESASQQYDNSLREIVSHNMFEQYNQTGWNFSLAKQVNEILLPQIIETVSMMWAGALHESGMAGKVYV